MNKIFVICVFITLYVLVGVVHSACPRENCSISSYLVTLNGEIDSLSCLQAELETVLKVLDPSSENYAIRNKQLEKVTKALDMLNNEKEVLANSVGGVVERPEGRLFLNGSKAVSCLAYRNATSEYLPDGLYQVELENRTLTVYCDMNTAGGGWTLFAGIAKDYAGPLFRVFDQSNAGTSSHNSTFHIVTTELLARSTYIMATCDAVDNVTTTFYTSKWPYSAYCEITPAFRSKIYNPLTPDDLPTTCYTVNGNMVNPTAYTYGISNNVAHHSIGFRMGTPYSGQAGHFDGKSWATFSYIDGRIPGEPNNGEYKGLGYHFGSNGAVNGLDNRNGALFLK